MAVGKSNFQPLKSGSESLKVCFFSNRTPFSACSTGTSQTPIFVHEVPIMNRNLFRKNRVSNKDCLVITRNLCSTVFEFSKRRNLIHLVIFVHVSMHKKMIVQWSSPKSGSDISWAPRNWGVVKMPHSFLKTRQKKGVKNKILGGVIAGTTRRSQKYVWKAKSVHRKEC